METTTSLMATTWALAVWSRGTEGWMNLEAATVALVVMVVVVAAATQVSFPDLNVPPDKVNILSLSFFLSITIWVNGSPSLSTRQQRRSLVSLRQVDVGWWLLAIVVVVAVAVVVVIVGPLTSTGGRLFLLASEWARFFFFIACFCNIGTGGHKLTWDARTALQVKRKVGFARSLPLGHTNWQTGPPVWVGWPNARTGYVNRCSLACSFKHTDLHCK